MNLFELSAKLSLNSAEFESGLAFAENGLKKFRKAALVAGAAATAAVVAFAKDAVETGAQFDSAMSQVAATMGVTVDEIQNLRDFAQEMGANTVFSATQAAEALNYMALAGYDADKSMAMLPTVLNLAAAGGFDLARASDMVTDAESALGLSTDQAAAMVDQMAKAASRSNTSVEQLGDAMLTVGGTAKFMSGGTDRLQTVLGLLADNGIKGSEAGTHLRNILLKLSSPTKDGAAAMETLGLKVFDAQGNMRDMQDIIGDLNKAFDGLTDQERIDYISTLFNSRDIAAVNALLGTSTERWNELGSAISEASGSARTMADTQLDNLNGDITLMKSALEGVKIQFSDGINPAIRDVVQRITRALSNPKTQRFLKEVGKFLGDIIKRVSELVSNVLLPRLFSLFEDGGAKLKLFGGIALGLVGTIKTVTTVLGVLGGTLSPTGLLLKGLGLLVGAFVAADLAQDDYVKNMRYLTDGQRALVNQIDEMNSAHQETASAYRDSATAVLEEKNRVTDLWKELQNLVNENGEVQAGMETRANFILGQLNEALGTEYTLNGNIIEQYQTMQGEIDNLIAKRAAESLLAAKEAEYTEALQKREEALRNAGKAHDEMAKAQALMNEKQEEATRLFRESAAAYDEADYARARELDEQAREAQRVADEAALAFGTWQNSYADAQGLAQEYYATVERYEKAQMDVFEGNYKDAQDILTKDFDYSLEIQRKKAANNLLEELKYKTMLKNKRAAIEEYRRNLLAGEEGFNEETLRKLVAQFNREVGEARKAGLNVGNAIGTGLADSQANVLAQATSLMRNAISRMRAEAQIASPSKKGRAIGANIGSSVGLGLEDSEDYVDQAAADLTKSALDNLAGETYVNTQVSGGNGSGRFEDAVLDILRDIRENIGLDLVMDDGTLVGWIDKKLGEATIRKARGNA